MVCTRGNGNGVETADSHTTARAPGIAATAPSTVVVPNSGALPERAACNIRSTTARRHT